MLNTISKMNESGSQKLEMIEILSQAYKIIIWATYKTQTS